MIASSHPLCCFALFAFALAAPAHATPAELEPGELCRAAIATAAREAGVPAGLLLAIGQVETGRADPATGRVSPWPWSINVEGQGDYLPSRPAAIEAVRQARDHGARLIDVGCMQINLHHHPQAFPDLETAFDPLANARYAARFLNALRAVCRNWLDAAGNYHSGTPERAEGYRSRVAAVWPGERLAAGPGGSGFTRRPRVGAALPPVPVPAAQFSAAARRARGCQSDAVGRALPVSGLRPTAPAPRLLVSSRVMRAAAAQGPVGRVIRLAGVGR